MAEMKNTLNRIKSGLNNAKEMISECEASREFY